MKTRKIRGQVSIEYMILLSVVLIMVMVVAGFMMGFISWGQTSEERASQAYWKSSEIAIPIWKGETAGLKFKVQNNMADRIKITAITFDGTAATLDPAAGVVLAPGQQTGATQTGPACTAGEPYSYEVVITYDDETYDMDALTFKGGEPIVGTCT